MSDIDGRYVMATETPMMNRDQALEILARDGIHTGFEGDGLLFPGATREQAMAVARDWWENYGGKTSFEEWELEQIVANAVFITW